MAAEFLLGGRQDLGYSNTSRIFPCQIASADLSLPEVLKSCDDCDGVITHDTGPLHLAGLTSTCLIGMFGPTDPATRIPRRPYSVGIWGGQGFACRSCYDGRDFAPCHFNGCMHQITPELVIRELDRLLSDRDQGQIRPWRIVVPEETAPSPFVGISPRIE
jgi:heptosyltransferase-2